MFGKIKISLWVEKANVALEFKTINKQELKIYNHITFFPKPEKLFERVLCNNV